MGALPKRDLSEGEAARLWAKDREALGTCGARHRALAAGMTALDEAFSRSSQ